MVSQSEKSRIQAMISSLSKILAGENSTALAVSSKNDELDILARTINALLQKNERSVSVIPKDATRIVVSNENEKHYLQILDRMQESYFETDLAGNFIFFNERLLKALNYTAAEFRGMNFRKILAPEHIRKTYKTFRNLFLTGEPVHGFEWRIVKKDGVKMDIETSAALLYGPDGKPAGFYGISHNITQRKQTDRQLKASEERYRDIVYSIEETYFEADLRGNLLFVNDSSPRDLQYSLEELQSKNFRIFTDEENAKKVYNAFHQVYLTGKPLKALEWKIFRKDGHVLDVESSVTLMLNDEGRPCGFRGITRDVSQRKETEKRLRLITENIRDVIWTRDFDLNLTYISPSIYRMTGFTTEEVLAAQTGHFSISADLNSLKQQLEEKLAYGKAHPFEKSGPMSLETQIKCKDGVIIWVEVNASFNRDERGMPFEIIGVTREITERKKAEEIFKESEKRYRMIVENMHDSIATLDLNFKPTYVSPSEIHTSGYTAEEALQLEPEQLLTPQSREFVRKVIADEFEKEFSGRPVDPHRVVTMEMEIYHKNGSTAWNEVQASFNRDENGKPVGIMLVSRDITERKKMEGILRESEKRYRMIVENMHDTIWTMDMDLHYTYQSPSEIRVTGYTPEEIMHIPIDKMLTPESFAQVSQMFAQELEKEFSGEPVDPTRSRTIELEMHHKKGHTIWQEISASFNRDENGKPVEIMLVGRDITERKKMEEALKESEKRYRMIVENMQDTISILDMNLNYVYQSPSEIRITGYTPEEIVKIPIERQVTPESLEKGLNILFEELGKEFSDTPVDPHRSIVFEVESYHKGGGSVWLEETCTFQRDESGKPVGILLAGRNITERKKAEQERDKLAAQLLHSQKMETVGRLAGGVAHDFNNMLNVILGYIDLAKMRLTMENPVYSDLIEIEKAATRSRDLTAQLLAFSRKQIISPKVVNLNELVAETQKTITRLIGEDIDLKFYPAENLWPIKFDPIQVEQILINLAVNARDAMYKGGKLIIETANISADRHFCDAHIDVAPGDYIQLSVSDTGVGIAKASLPHVFEPFFTTKEFGKGTGLGLSTVYGIVKQNNGFISVYSEPGQGSTFKIYIPRTGEALNITARLPEKPAKSGSGTILLVEDDEMVLKMVSDMLEALGYMVIASENPLDALSLCEKGVTPIDLVITDVVMPQMSGKELRDKLIARSTDMKILFMSGYTSNIIAQHGVLEEGMQFIQKPFSINMLSEKVKQMIAVK